MIHIKRRYARSNRLTHLILGCGYDDADDQDDSLEHSGIARHEEDDGRPREPSPPYALDLVREREEEVRDQKRCVRSPCEPSELHSFARIQATSLLTGGGDDAVVLYETRCKFKTWQEEVETTLTVCCKRLESVS